MPRLSARRCGCKNAANGRRMAQGTNAVRKSGGRRRHRRTNGRKSRMPEHNTMYLIDRMQYILSTGIFADVYFLVGADNEKELLPAHKLILSSASDVFEAMFRFDAANAMEINDLFINPSTEVINPVVVTDVDLGSFKAMLSFIYTDELGELNGDNVLGVLYAAKKYNISLLVEACVNFPIRLLPNVFLAFSVANFLEEKVLLCRCLDYIDQNAETLFKTSVFLNIDQNLLCTILERDQLRIKSEIKIWKAALRWADKQCEQNGIDCLAQNRRAILGPALFKIRFPLIPQSEFVKQIVPCGVLTQQETEDVLLCHNLPLTVASELCSSDLCLSSKFLFPFERRFLTAPMGQHISIQQKNRGFILMKIKQFAKFAWGAATKGEANADIFEKVSHPFFVRGMKWRILALSQAEAGNGAKRSLGFFLHCDRAKDIKWSFKCSASLQILSRLQKRKAENFTRKFSGQIYGPNSNVWGFNSFIIFEELMDPRNGLYNKNNTVTLCVDFTVDDAYEDEQQQQQEMEG